MGVAWAFKLAVLEDGKRPSDISLADLRRGKDRAERTCEGIESGAIKFSEENRNVALQMWRMLLIREAETEDEIARAPQRSHP